MYFIQACGSLHRPTLGAILYPPKFPGDEHVRYLTETDSCRSIREESGQGSRLSCGRKGTTGVAREGIMCMLAKMEAWSVLTRVRAIDHLISTSGRRLSKETPRAMVLMCIYVRVRMTAEQDGRFCEVREAKPSVKRDYGEYVCTLRVRWCLCVSRPRTRAMGLHVVLGSMNPRFPAGSSRSRTSRSAAGAANGFWRVT